MRINRRGGIGFTEAIVAVMVVTVVIGLYLGAFAHSMHGGDGRDPDFDEDIAAAFSVAGGVLTADADEALTELMERHGYRGITLRCRIPGGIAGDDVLALSVGQTDGEVSGCRFLHPVAADDGRVLAAVFEAGVYR